MGKETECPICSAYIPVEEEVRDGDHIYCSYCGTQLMIKLKDLIDQPDETAIEAEEDW